MKIFSKENLYLTLWLMLGFGVAILDMGIIALVGYYFVSFDPAKYWQYSDQIFFIGAITWLVLLLIYSYLAIALGRISWQKIYIDGVRGKKYIIKK